MTTPNHLLAIDQGTTSTRAMVFDRECRPTGQAQKEFPQHFPSPGQVEHVVTGRVRFGERRDVRFELAPRAVGRPHAPHTARTAHLGDGDRIADVERF